MAASIKAGSVALVDSLVDENGSPIDVGEDRSLKIAEEFEPVVGGTSATNWWRAGLIALFIVAALLLALQLLNGNHQTDVVPGTPIAAPPEETTTP